MPYNLPPWKYMKEQYFMMSLLILGPKDRDMDIFLRPIVDKLKLLWAEAQKQDSIVLNEIMSGIVGWRSN